MWIFGQMQLYEEAVEVALALDVRLAMDYANLPDDAAEKKRLWLTIAKHVIENRSLAVAESARILEECPLLNIEDILPFFPDFVVIDTFKSEICASLEDYNRNIEQLKSETDECIRSGAAVREQITALAQEQLTLPADTRCALSGAAVVSGPFYYFNSGYAYLASAVVARVSRHLGETEQKRVADLQHWLKHHSEHSLGYGTRETELDSLVASECPLTGALMIESIDERLCTPSEAADWALL